MLILGTSGSNGSAARSDGGDLTNTTVSKDAFQPTHVIAAHQVFTCDQSSLNTYRYLWVGSTQMLAKRTLGKPSPSTERFLL
jgi:hypothetical protein